MSNSVQPHGRQPTRLPCPWDSPGKNTGVGCHCLLQCMKVKSESEVAQSCSTLSDPMDCSLPGSSIHGIFQARVLEWSAIAFSGTSYEFWSVFKFLTSLIRWMMTGCGIFNRIFPDITITFLSQKGTNLDDSWIRIWIIWPYQIGW